MFNVSRETELKILEIIKKCQQNPMAIEKVTTAGIAMQTGLQYYDLQPGAKLLYPVQTPLRNETPRVRGKGGDSTNWKSVTGVNVGRTSLGVAEGRRNAVMQISAAPKLASYATLGLENVVTDESVFAGEGFDDVRALAVQMLLQAMMIGEEGVLYAGNKTLALGTTPTPTVATSTSNGGIAATTAVSVICVALTHEGLQNASLAAGVPAVISRTNADGSTDSFGGGSARKSAAATVTTGAGSTNSVTAVVTPVRGAFGYAWYWGPADSEKLGAITTINSVVITVAQGTGSQTAASLPASDNSRNGLVFDGLLTQIADPNSGAYYATQANGTLGTGTPLTADGAGGIVEIDTALRYFWDNFKTSPDEMMVSSQELVNITRKVIAGGSAPLFRFTMDAGANESAALQGLTAGSVVGSYLNKFSLSGGQLVKVRLHPNATPGTISFRKRTLPYPISNVANVMEVMYQQDYYQAEWPRNTRSYEYGVYSRELLAVYAPFCFGMLTNIGNG